MKTLSQCSLDFTKIVKKKRSKKNARERQFLITALSPNIIMSDGFFTFMFKKITATFVFFLQKIITISQSEKKHNSVFYFYLA